MNSWTPFQSTLKELYDECDCGYALERDSSYLSDAYRRVEEFWQKSFRNIAGIRLLILGEAPLWGKTKQAYFYNPAAKASSFFCYKDAEKLIGDLPHSSTLKGDMRLRKSHMISQLTDAGVVILDLFPFSFNKEDTALQYPGLVKHKTYRWLFQRSMQYHFLPKVTQLETADTSRLRIAFRYSRSEGLLQESVKKIFLEKSLIVAGQNIPSIHLGRNIDRAKLKKLFGENVNA